MKMIYTIYRRIYIRLFFQTVLRLIWFLSPFFSVEAKYAKLMETVRIYENENKQLKSKMKASLELFSFFFTQTSVYVV